MNVLHRSIAVLAVFLLASQSVYAQPHKEAYNAARELAQAKDYEGALAKFNEAAAGARAEGDADTERRANNVASQINNLLGNAALKAQDFAGALSYFSAAITANEANLKARYSVGLALKNLDRMDEALDHWRAVAGATGDRRTSLAAEGAIRAHFVALASAALGKRNATSNDADAAITALESMRDYVDADADFHFYMGQALYLKGDVDAAISAADQALAIHSGSRTDKAKIYYLKGEALVKAGNRDGARAAFEEARFGSYKASAEHYLESL